MVLLEASFLVFARPGLAPAVADLRAVGAAEVVGVAEEGALPRPDAALPRSVLLTDVKGFSRCKGRIKV